MCVKWLAAALVAFAPAVVLGHPGHHDGGAEGLRHVLTQGDHLLALLALVACVVNAPRAYRWLRRPRRNGNTAERLR